MATANMPPGAVPASHGDPFTNNSPSNAHPAPLRYAAFDNDQFSLYATNSPSSARRALEAHLKDTDRRIQDASRLGTTLIQQRKDLASRLEEVQQMQHESEMPPDLQQKLAELEREYNQVGRESARAFLPKSRVVSEAGQDPNASGVISGSGRESPTKLSAPSRRQRNQPSNRVHDIEFATEISTSLLAQVRQLQAALAEKDEELKDTASAKAHLEAEADALMQRVRHMDDNEQKYKDENWNLETRLQDLEANLKQSADKENRLASTLKSVQSEMAAKERELDDLKVSHNRLNENHAMAKRVQEADLHGLRRDVASHETERTRMQRKIEELTAQNTELAKAVSYRFNQAPQPSDTDFVSADENVHSDDQSPMESAPTSPVKGTPRHGMLESETLKSSLNHAHRMIQNLKNTIHREKTEKIELKRMLQDARDELETRRDSSAGIAANVAKKRRSEPEGIKFKRPATANRLGAARSSTTEIIEDEPDWEDHSLEQTPSKPRSYGMAAGGPAVRDLSHNEEDTTDAFETANERDTTESEAFATGNEDFDQDTEGEATETEGGAGNALRSVSSISSKPGDRRSFMSTASDEDDDLVKTPLQHPQQPKYRLRLGKGGRRSGRVSDVVSDSPGVASIHSPSSSTGGTPQAGQMQSLGDELDALDDDSAAGTPASSRVLDDYTRESTPATQRFASVEPGTPSSAGATSFEHASPSSIVSPKTALPRANESGETKPVMIDSGVMTEPWEPEPRVVERIVEKEVEAAPEKQSLKDRAGELVGGALAGFGISRVMNNHEESHTEPDSHGQAAAGAPDNVEGEDLTSRDRAAAEPEMTSVGTDAVTEKPVPISMQQSAITSEELLPASSPRPVYSEKALDARPLSSRGLQQSSEEVSKNEPSMPVPAPKPAPLSFSDISAQEIEPIAAFRSDTEADAALIPPTEQPVLGTDQARVGAGFFAAVKAPSLLRKRSRSLPGSQRSVRFEPREDAQNESTAMPDGDDGRQPMAESGSQTVMSGREIDSIIRSKTVPAGSKDAGNSPMRGAALSGAATAAALASTNATPTRERRRSIDSGPSIYESPSLRSPRRPTSAGSMRHKGASAAPPLPTDHTQKIAAAHQTPSASTGQISTGAMGPPVMPASAYKARPKTPLDRTSSRDGPTPRAAHAKEIREAVGNQSSDRISHRTSVSSFASELDTRFNIHRGQIMYPADVEPSTDPRMIQAITQTMIGEYLWKYTRKPGRSETSNTRHRRFFWVHPYTRTLYWSEQDPSTAGKNMIKAKSVAIEAVRVVTDDNSYPPGLHRKSLVVVTPGREIVFTAPTGQRHETWFNALSYLLLRTEREKGEAEDNFDGSDLDEFNPGIGRTVRQSIRNMTGRSQSRQSRQSRASLSSYNSRSTRPASPQKHDHDRTLTGRHATGTVRQSSLHPHSNGDGLATTVSNTSRTSSASVSGRFSSLAGRFRPGSSQRATSRTSVRRPDDPASIYDASVVGDSAEDLRAFIERQEREADRLENVRACCDGKHDVGSLSNKNGRHASFGSRFGSQGHHSHSHAHPRA